VSRRRLVTASLSIALLTSFMVPGASAQGRPTALALTRVNADDLRAWDSQVDVMIRNRDLRIREVQGDPLVPDRQHQRLDQYYRFVRIVGGDLTRQLARDGTISIFGTLHTGIELNTTPALSVDDAETAIGRAASGRPREGSIPELVVLPLADGYHLSYFGQATTDVDVVNVFVDANTGGLLRQYSDFVTDVGIGKGTYGDNKKISTTAMSGTFVTDDKLRPAAITTYDMKGNFSRTQALLGSVPPTTTDIASNTNNLEWTDGTVVDAHVYAGWYYDYLFKRFGRHGLDDRDLRMPVLTHPVRLSDISTASPEVRGLYYLNAFYCATCGPNARGAILFGEGAPRGFLGPNIEVKAFSAAFDVVAHELTHGVVASTARLGPSLESGSLNEGFADVFGTSTMFFYQPPGSGPMQASYLLGKDLTIPSGLFARSLSNPAETANSDHYSRRGIEVHFNSTILSHAFYLAIEGGINRTSGLAVQGVGAANRDQIEKAFFRALTLLLSSSANFGMTRSATIQAARDLYGTGGAVERAITQAWDAVGVQERSGPTATAVAVPVSAAVCSGPLPSWEVDPIVSAGTSSLTISQWQLDLFDSSGRTLNTFRETASDFVRLFSVCGPGSSRVPAQSDACSALCINLGGATSGALQFTFTATDDANRPVTFGTARVPLSR
jgi:Zn-dependent metalloprotease